jgi:hypothetical protein
MFGGPGAGVVGGAGLFSGGGPLEQVVDANLKRYVEVTPQVRRMPVGIAVVVDQAYLQDVLVALANSPLRCQVPQVPCNRFRGSIDTGTPGYGSPEGPGGEGGLLVGAGGASVGGGLSELGSPDGSESGFGGPGGRPGGIGLPGPGGRPGGIGLPGPGGLGPFAGGPGGYGPGYGGTGYGPGFGAGGAITSVSEAQLTSGLIQLNVYGVVSLYSNPDAVPVNPVAPTEPEAKEGDPSDKEPKDKDNEPKEPMPGTTPAPKTRRRFR